MSPPGPGEREAADTQSRWQKRLGAARTQGSIQPRSPCPGLPAHLRAQHWENLSSHHPQRATLLQQVLPVRFLNPRALGLLFPTNP